MNTHLDSCYSTNLQAKFLWLACAFTSERSSRVSLIENGNRILNYKRCLLGIIIQSELETMNVYQKRDAQEIDSW